ncbi:MAG TPA: prepilin-type N-terminal cleavage/methylation domain-containing protein [Phycisphaerae bacterium]|nr:prepilin-type N-terminal cleavage/methylation domain-containing protein [Phycisphaerae bacterium]
MNGNAGYAHLTRYRPWYPADRPQPPKIQRPTAPLPVPGQRRSPARTGFTLIEVLVVTAVVALLVSILLPSLARARNQAKGALCLSNLGQIGKGLVLYLGQHRDRYPEHSSRSSMSPRKRWPDYLHPQMKQEKIYECPSLTAEQKEHCTKAWAHDPGKRYGGYGYNFQYLGNSRTGTAVPDWQTPYHAPASSIRMPALTLAVADTRGSKAGKPENLVGQGGAAVYVVDPPLGSKDLGSKGARAGNDPAKLWYEGGTQPVTDEYLWRSRPEERHLGKVNALFADGHAESIKVDKLDGRQADGAGDNRYYSGVYDPLKW